MRVYVNLHLEPSMVEIQLWERSTINGLTYEEVKDLYSRLGACIDTIEANPDAKKGVSQ
jgi:hypothetical protein